MMSKLRVALVTGEFPPMQGGVGAFTQELARELALLDLDVWILTDEDAKPDHVRPRKRILQEPLPLKGYARWLPFGRKWNWRDVGWLADCAERYNFDVVNIQYQAAAYNMRSPAIHFAPFRLRHLTRTVVTFHDLRTPYLFPKAGSLREQVVRRMAKSADGVIVTNSADAARLEPVLATPPALIPIGSNIAVQAVDEDTRTQARADIGVGPLDLLLGYFGFLNESKGADTLLEALAQLDDRVHLVFIGGRTGASDPDNNAAFYERLDAQIARLGLGDRVHWTGFVADAQVSTWLTAADLMVMPYRDGASLRRGTLMAVLAHGRPLITTTPQTPLPEFVHGENVWLVSADSPAALHDAIATLRVQPDTRRRLGAGAALLAKRFTWDKIALQTRELYQTVLNRV